MKQIFKKINLVKTMEIVVAVFVLIFPVVSFAALGNVDCQSLGGGLNCSTTTASGLLKQVITWMLGLAGLISVLFLIIGGFWYITSAGNEETAEKGKNTAINAIIGIVIIVLSWVIVNVVSNLASTSQSGQL